MRIAHAPDPQTDDWLAIVIELSRLSHVQKINFHARSEDQYCLCPSCGVRLVNTKAVDHTCDYCGVLLRSDLPEKAERNSSEMLIQKIRAACDAIPNRVILTLENTYEPPQYFNKLFDALPAKVGFTLDIGHANIFHNAPIEYVYLLKSRLCHLHLHDNTGGNSELYHDSHSPPGSGSVNWLLVAKALKQARFEGTATYECKPDDAWFRLWH
jgi:predicted RNA-binding Zn-ribbon protein involved in translation (DUF1610 family)